MSKIGILGGSFNPIHKGHIYIAEEVSSQLSLDDVIFIPTGYAPHKDNGIMASKEDRYNIVKLAVGDEFSVSDIEIKKDKPCYAVETMTDMQALYPNDILYYIIGADSLESFMTWKEPLKLFKMLNIVVVDRDNTDVESIAQEFRQKFGAKITVCHIDKVNISSTEVRNNFKLYGNSCGLVPKMAEEYIIKHKIYTEEI